jgi:hypothetical protein
LLSSASFGKSAITGKWTDLAGASFEGALLSSSDTQRICENPVRHYGARLLGLY